MGLGLAIVRHITELHGGSVSVSSGGENQGAIFTVELPLMPIVNSQTADTRHPTPDTPLSNLRILVVDDEPDMRDLVVATLEPSGAIVQAASSAADALQAIATSAFDLLICDIGMPDMDGHMLMRQIRSTDRQISAIALTAFASESDRAAAIAAGFQLHLGKPIDPQDLIEKIAVLMQCI
ncbi:MAG: hybrid sensor histidine kinase/response regulator [Leptolyngbyaceae cyanobacterium SM1_3_5]|nr:hybrid sensor histidine kinase/response regulator [Leptolyngbyaceae cyanobacterium SM1_3_5]